nr:MAG TPA: macrophage colony stimulating factor-like protein [Caudoviricetes sp.]DAO63336.1 MAG TPA: macrophage colony stimulating factor-like protein [Caudoviricetes sp.]
MRFKNGLGGNRTRVQKPIHMRLSHYSQSSFIPSTVLRLTGSQLQ